MNNITKYKNIIQLGVLGSLFSVTSVMNAGIFDNTKVLLKAYGGSTSDSYRYESYKNTADSAGLINSNTVFKKSNAANLLTPGIGLLFEQKLDKNSIFTTPVNFGLEINIQRQLEGYKFDQDLDFNSMFLLNDGEQSKVQIDNKLKASLSAVLKLADVFYIKAGPSYLKQQLRTVVFQSDIPKLVSSVSQKDKLDLFGLNAGTGLVYRVTKNVKAFTEFNYTYFFQKDLRNFVVDPSLFPNNLGAAYTADPQTFERKVRFSQLEYLVGMMINLDGIGQ